MAKHSPSNPNKRLTIAQKKEILQLLEQKVEMYSSSISNENEALYQSARLQKFAKKTGSPKADQLLEEAKRVLFK